MRNQLSPVDNSMEARKALASLYLARQGFEVNHQHGQRISTNVQFKDEDMSQMAYNEIFIGKLPRDLFENELLPHLKQVGGRIHKIRYMMDFSGSNRGFCFVKFATTAEAVRACHLLDGKVLRPGCPAIGVKISFDNKCLFFGNLPPECNSGMLVRALRKAEIAGIVGAQMADEIRTVSTNNNYNFSFNSNSNFNNNNFNINNLNHNMNPIQMEQIYNNRYGNRSPPSSRYGYVYFESHDAATKARRLLLPSDVKLLGRKITLDWAKSEIPNDVANLLRAPWIAPQPISQHPMDLEFCTHWVSRPSCRV